MADERDCQIQVRANAIGKSRRWQSNHIRAAKLVDLRWEQADLENAILHVRRVKQGTPATHPLTGRELRALRRLQREQGSKSPFVFVSERSAPFSKRGFQAQPLAGPFLFRQRCL